MKAALVAAALLWSISAQAAEWSAGGGNASRLGFVGSQGGSPFEGRFERWTAKIDFDPANPAAGRVVVDIDMTSAATGDRQKDDSLPQAEWFDAATFPRARFEAAGFRATGGNAYEAAGRLTIRGIGKDVVLPFTLDIAGTTARAKGRLPLIRTDYGIGQGPWKTGETVALDVAVTFDLTATRKD
ncbi:YceI family protein [Magnetospirillum sp. SS-4]|uniref:YceI family protein n=1 Tax=Magnetospirillum sp. SS-4 TaxID=2681465 RepID=UPI00137C4767|nr:YceI family protein [Magnetospirillum sp. SS-4]CAA7627394.1 YceI family protein [Magnetospirillum sp. SS-4]